MIFEWMDRNEGKPLWWVAAAVVTPLVFLAIAGALLLESMDRKS